MSSPPPSATTRRPRPAGHAHAWPRRRPRHRQGNRYDRDPRGPRLPTRLRPRRKRRVYRRAVAGVYPATARLDLYPGLEDLRSSGDWMGTSGNTILPRTLVNEGMLVRRCALGGRLGVQPQGDVLWLHSEEEQRDCYQ